MNPAKIRLSTKEMELVMNADWILTKNEIMGKINSFLAQLQITQNEMINRNQVIFPEEIINCSPKISKGENYKGLPYMVLDYPRIFSKEKIFAIRTMFWWGNFFSCTLHLSGVYKSEYEKKIISQYQKLKALGFFLSLNKNEWEHHFEAENFFAITDLKQEKFETVISNHSFIKIAGKIPLAKWNEAEDLLLKQFSVLIEVLVS